MNSQKIQFLHSRQKPRYGRDVFIDSIQGLNCALLDPLYNGSHGNAVLISQAE